MTCCAPGCEHKPGLHFGCHFYNFPSPNDGRDWEKWFDIWLKRINRVNKDGGKWLPSANTKLCSCHFRPDDQWDPKSRRGGLKCKEPVYFNYSTPFVTDTVVIPNQHEGTFLPKAQSGDDMLSIQSTTGTTGYISPPIVNRDMVTNVAHVRRKKHLKQTLNGLRKNKLLRTYSRMPTLKIRQYLEQTEHNGVNLKDCDAAFGSPNIQASPQDDYLKQIPSSKSVFPNDYDRQNPDEVVSTHEEDGHEASMNLGSASHSADAQQNIVVPIALDFIHPYSSVHQITPPRSTNSEEEHCQTPNDGYLEDGRVSQQINDDLYQSQIPDIKEEQEDSVLPLREVAATTVPQPNKAKISNVKPIRIHMSRNQSVDTMEPAVQLTDLSPKESYNIDDAQEQMFTQLLSPRKCSSGSEGQPHTAVGIAAMLTDHSKASSGQCSLNQTIARVEDLEKALKKQHFGLHRYSGSDEKIQFYTGFKSADTLMRFFWRIEPDDLTTERSSKWKNSIQLAHEQLYMFNNQEYVATRTLAYMDELFLFLNHIWLGLQPQDLADRFSLPSAQDAQFIILKWIYYLNVTLPSLPLNLRCGLGSAKCVNFHGQYRNTRVLLHPAEIKVQQKSFRNHISSTRLRSLVGIAPSGAVVFISDLLSDVTCGEDLLRRCGVLSLLQGGDGVMMEDSFLNDANCVISTVGATVHRLPSVDLSHNEALFQQGLSSGADTDQCNSEVARLLFAKYISAVRGFRCFHSVVMRPFAGVASMQWKVCCRLVNYQHGHQSL